MSDVCKMIAVVLDIYCSPGHIKIVLGSVLPLCRVAQASSSYSQWPSCFCKWQLFQKQPSQGGVLPPY